MVAQNLDDRGPLSHGAARFDLRRTAQNHGPSLAVKGIFLKGILDLSVFH
jgi:hypothetical protein